MEVARNPLKKTSDDRSQGWGFFSAQLQNVAEDKQQITVVKSFLNCTSFLWMELEFFFGWGFGRLADFAFSYAITIMAVTFI